MRAWQLPRWGIDELELVELPDLEPAPGEVLLRHRAASVNYRDYQICTGEFAPNERLPIVPLSDGAGEVVAVGDAVDEWQVGDRVCPTFFPRWLHGEALADERAVSLGLEVPGVLRELGLYRPEQLVRIAPQLDFDAAACFPCAGLTAWTCVHTLAGIGREEPPGGEAWVLVEGTGGVALFGLQFAKALGAKVIVVSGSDEKLAMARELGADHGINYREQPAWGPVARELSGGRGVDCVVEIGGEGTLPQAVRALRRGGHIGVVGYLAGLGLGLTVFDLIERNAHLHGLSVGNRDGFIEMMQAVERYAIQPVIHARHAFEEAPAALDAIARGTHVGKRVIQI